MNERMTRCALINLSALSVEILTFPNGCDGWGIHMNTLAHVWKQNPGMIALSTGPLTGTGAPGTGGMVWCEMHNGLLKVIPTEGRFGAACRYGQIDHLLFTGVAAQACNLLIQEGVITFSSATPAENTAQEIYEICSRQGHAPDSVILTIGNDGILEDGYFPLGGSGLANRLREKNLQSIVASWMGSMPLYDSESFLTACVSLYQEHQKTQQPDAGKRAMTRYLSIQNEMYGGAALSKPIITVEETAESMLGLHWKDALCLQDPLEHMARLLHTCTGKKVSAHDIEQSARRLLNDVQKIRIRKGGE